MCFEENGGVGDQKQKAEVHGVKPKRAAMLAGLPEPGQEHRVSWRGLWVCSSGLAIKRRCF